MGIKSKFWTLNFGKNEMCWAKTHKGPAGLLSGFCSSLTSLTAEPPVVSAVMANINEPSEQQTCDGKRAAYAANHEWSWPVRWSVLRIRRSAGTAYKYIWGSSRGRKRLYLKTLQTLTLDEWVGSLWSDGHSPLRGCLSSAVTRTLHVHYIDECSWRSSCFPSACQLHLHHHLPTVATIPAK